MAKRKTAPKKVATPAVTGDQKAPAKAADSSPAPAKKAEKKPEPETRRVCFTDQDSGKRFCGEVTEVPKEKPKAKKEKAAITGRRYYR